MSSVSPIPAAPDADPLRSAETALKRLGYARIPPVVRDATVQPAFWVQEAGVPRRTFPVFVGAGGADRSIEGVRAWMTGNVPVAGGTGRAIVVVPSDRDAEVARVRVEGAASPVDSELSILVVPAEPEAEGVAHWHAIVLPPREVLRIATGVVVGLFRRAEANDGPAQIDFSEMLDILRRRFRIDLRASLHVDADEDLLFMLYQLAQRDAYAPGDAASNLHSLVLRPTGPGARLPWFAA